ncbi:hypothetical protein HY839_03360 [Candidatus Azambacteria bacterium]|nr:hypothetical protein [Candidatus Azambacteria bacterium]
MSYTIALHKYHTTRTARFAQARSRDTGEYALLVIGICAVVALAALYVVEANTLMFLERTVPVKESVVSEVKNSVQGLEIQATQMQSSQKVQEAALSKEMVFLNAVSYVNAGESSVAMAGTGITR